MEGERQTPSWRPSRAECFSAGTHSSMRIDEWKGEEGRLKELNARARKSSKTFHRELFALLIEYLRIMRPPPRPLGGLQLHKIVPRSPVTYDSTEVSSYIRYDKCGNSQEAKSPGVNWNGWIQNTRKITAIIVQSDRCSVVRFNYY